MIKSNDNVLVLGGGGLVGSALIRELVRRGHNMRNIHYPTRNELDLEDSDATYSWFLNNRNYDYVLIAAARVGGIVDNAQNKAEFLVRNLTIQNNVMMNITGKVKKVMFLGSSCIYPREAPVPIKEEYFMTGPLESTNDAYAIAKIAGIKLAQSLHTHQQPFISLMPTNLYGYNDRFGYKGAHVIPALIDKYHHAKEKGLPSVTNLGTGNALREFMFSDDFAHAALAVFDEYESSDIVNIGVGYSTSIRDLAEMIASIVGYEGETLWSGNMDGTPVKTLDISKMESIIDPIDYHSLEEGLVKTYQWYLNSYK